ncbi:hypothetical protein QE152_g13913 [Popillia japonica]|uniref:Uncharacterized protein n=1 Tax=Popillia japonica TaxID=7064 RepID=A0AAW1LA87_POPJA
MLLLLLSVNGKARRKKDVFKVEALHSTSTIFVECWQEFIRHFSVNYDIKMRKIDLELLSIKECQLGVKAYISSSLPLTRTTMMAMKLFLGVSQLVGAEFVKSNYDDGDETFPGSESDETVRTDTAQNPAASTSGNSDEATSEKSVQFALGFPSHQMLHPTLP